MKRNSTLILTVIRGKDEVMSTLRRDWQFGIDRNNEGVARSLDAFRLKTTASQLHEAVGRLHLYSEYVALANVVRVKPDSYCQSYTLSNWQRTVSRQMAPATPGKV